MYISDRSCRENQNIYCIFNNAFYRALYEIMWKNMVRMTTK